MTCFNIHLHKICYLLFPSIPLDFDECCECYILQALFPCYVSQISDSYVYKDTFRGRPCTAVKPRKEEPLEMRRKWWWLCMKIVFYSGTLPLTNGVIRLSIAVAGSEELSRRHYIRSIHWMLKWERKRKKMILFFSKSSQNSTRFRHTLNNLRLKASQFAGDIKNFPYLIYSVVFSLGAPNFISLNSSSSLNPALKQT